MSDLGKCPKCGRGLTLKSGRYGNFVGCTGYPECKYTQDYNDEEDKSETSKQPESTKREEYREGRFCIAVTYYYEKLASKQVHIHAKVYEKRSEVEKAAKKMMSDGLSGARIEGLYIARLEEVRQVIAEKQK